MTNTEDFISRPTVADLERDDDASSESSDDPDSEDVRDKIFGWKEKDKRKFQKLWKSITGETEESLKAVGVKMVMWMFDNISSMREQFNIYSTNHPNEDMTADKLFLKHSQDVVMSLDGLINNLCDAKQFEKDMRAMLRKHIELKPPVTVDYLEKYRDSIPLFVLEATGKDKDSKQANQFKHFMDGMVKVFQNEWLMHRKQTEAAAKSGCCSGCTLI